MVDLPAMLGPVSSAMACWQQRGKAGRRAAVMLQAMPPQQPQLPQPDSKQGYSGRIAGQAAAELCLHSLPSKNSEQLCFMHVTSCVAVSLQRA